MGAIENEKIYGLKIRESANDGSDFSNPEADYRLVFLGEDGLLHVKDSAGSVTDPYPAGGTFDPDVHMAWHVPLIPTIWTPEASTGTWAIGGLNVAGASPFVEGTNTVGDPQITGLRCTSAAQNDAVAWDVPLAAGTWDANFWVCKAASFGIITLNQDGASMGTLDLYGATTAYATGAITGWTVSATGKKRMQLSMATKNASSSAYGAFVIAIEFRRTA